MCLFLFILFLGGLQTYNVNADDLSDDDDIETDSLDDPITDMDDDDDNSSEDASASHKQKKDDVKKDAKKKDTEKKANNDASKKEDDNTENLEDMDDSTDENPEDLPSDDVDEGDDIDDSSDEYPTITEQDILFSKINSDNTKFTGLSKKEDIYNKIPDNFTEDELYKVSNSKLNIVSSNKVNIYDLERMFCSGEEPMKNKILGKLISVDPENGNIFIYGYFKGKLTKIKILGVKIPQYKMNYRPVDYTQYYLKIKPSSIEEKIDDKILPKSDVLTINGYTRLSSKKLNSYKQNTFLNDYYIRQAVVFLDLILRDQTVFVAFDREIRDENGFLTAYIYLKNGKCLNATLVSDGLALLDQYLNKTNKTMIYFESEFRKYQESSIKLQKGIHYHTIK